MKRPALALTLLCLILVGLLAARPHPAAASTPLDAATAAQAEGGLSQCMPDGQQGSGAVYRICMPPNWWYNDQLVIWAHGYVAFDEPIAIPEDQLCIDGFCIPDITNTLGFGFATTSYSVNGLAIQAGIADILDLIDIYTAEIGAPEQIYLIGASEGGIITTLMLEQYPDLFASGVSMCGPIGNFQWQINYFGDFRAAFDVFFPGLMPGDPVDIPDWLIANWDAYYDNVIEPVVFNPANASRLNQLVSVTHLPYDANDYLNSLHVSVADALWYNVFATNDAVEKLGGQPFSNIGRWYRGSNNDVLLNVLVERIAADPAATAEIEAAYQTSGDLLVPMVTLHTRQDQQVPYWHQPLYGFKVRAAGNQANRVNLPINRFEQCNFTPTEALVAFGIAYAMANPQPLAAEWIGLALPDPAALAHYEQLMEAYMPR